MGQPLFLEIRLGKDIGETTFPIKASPFCLARSGLFEFLLIKFILFEIVAARQSFFNGFGPL